MVLRNHFVWFVTLLLSSLLLQSGCVYNVPVTPNAAQDLEGVFSVDDRIHAKVGVYISDDVRNYVIKREKMGMGFQMDVGKHLVLIAMAMAGKMFDQAVEVNSPPPYMGGYRPDIEAVMEPEILYAYGNVRGAFAGQVEAKIKFRVKVYDLSGKVIWQGDALGESRSENVDFVATFLAGMDQVGRVGYQAGIFAAKKIINDFNASKPPELYALLDVKDLAKSGAQKKSGASEAADKLYQKGLSHFDKKNFEQALYGFQQAAKLSPDDLVIKFYVGVCYMYTGQRARALEELKAVLAKNPKADKLSGDCKSWIQRMNDPLKIGVMFAGSQDSFPEDLRKRYLEALRASGMYDIAEVKDAEAADPQTDTAAFNKHLEDSSKKKIRVVILVQGLRSMSELTDPSLPADGDRATEFELNASVRPYGTQKKKAVSDFLLTDASARIKKQTEPEKAAVSSGLAQRSSSRVILSLLGSEIF
jgi:tetratricopeptide (TPR) repeat protein